MRKHIIALLMLAVRPAVGAAQQREVLLDTVLVTAAKVAHPLKATAPVQRWSREAMWNSGATTLADVLLRMAGLTLRDYGGAGGQKTVSVRGMGSKQTAVMYDGVVLSDVQSGEVDLSKFSLDQLQAVQLTVGDGDNLFVPAQQLYAPATLSLETLQPTAPLTVQTRLTVGSWQQWSPSLLVAQRISPHFSYSAQGQFTRATNDYPFLLRNVTLTTAARRSHSALRSGHSEVNARWTINERQTLTVKGLYDDGWRELPGPVHYYTEGNSETLRDQQAVAQLRWRNMLSARWAWQTQLRWQWKTTRYATDVASGGTLTQHYKQQEWYASSTLLFSPNHHWEWAYATDVSLAALRSNLRETLTPVPGQPPISGAPERRTLLQSLSAKWLPSPTLTVVARLLQGNHWERVAEGEGSPGTVHHISPSISLSWQPWPQQPLRLRAYGKTTLRMPTFTELYFYHVGSTALRPERSWQTNVGLTWHGRRGHNGLAVQASLDVFASQTRDKIVAVPLTSFVWRMMNVGRTAALGVDATMAVQQRWRAHTLEWTMSGSLQRVVDVSHKASPAYGLQLPYTPLCSFASGLSWRNKWLCAALSVEGATERWTLGNHVEGSHLPPWAVADAAVWRAWQWKKWRVTARLTVKNVMNHQYDIVKYYPMPGRSWQATLAVEL